MAATNFPTPEPKLLPVLVCILCVFYLLDTTHAASTPIIAQTPWGPVEGLIKITATGFTYASFIGIPYALPPVGKLRFAKPVPSDGNPVIPYKAHFAKPSCYSFFYFGEMSEDCLYLNIYVPLTNKQPSMSVVFNIHGGGFMLFPGNPDVTDFIARGAVIMVTSQYRLGAFGFLSTGDGELKGNYGLWDQNLALKWVKDNIAGFGGNPDSITLMGVSAGGASVGFQALAPPSKATNVWKDVQDEIIPMLLDQRFDTSYPPEVLNLVYDYYRNGRQPELLDSFMVANAFADPAFIIPSIEVARAFSDVQTIFKGPGKTFHYYMDYCPAFSPNLCMRHALDQTFLFKSISFTTPADVQMSVSYTSLMTTFATTSQPLAPNLYFPWPLYTALTGYKSLRIGPVFSEYVNIFPVPVSMWLNVIPRTIDEFHKVYK